jgi:hypothetical protein
MGRRKATQQIRFVIWWDRFSEAFDTEATEIDPKDTERVSILPL